MGVVAVVPARGGSKGVPGKNLRRVGGRTLVARCVATALSAAEVGDVLVSTDSDGIAAEAVAAGGRVVARPPQIPGDEASSESAVLPQPSHAAPGAGRVRRADRAAPRSGAHGVRGGLHR